MTPRIDQIPPNSPPKHHYLALNSDPFWGQISVTDMTQIYPQINYLFIPELSSNWPEFNPELRPKYWSKMTQNMTNLELIQRIPDFPGILSDSLGSFGSYGDLNTTDIDPSGIQNYPN